MDRTKWKIGLQVTDLKKMGLLLLLSLFYILSPLQAKAGTWTSVGPYGGYIRSLAISPNYASDQTIFAGTSGGGVLKSTNGGTSWNKVNTGLSNLYVYSLVISPNSDQTIFAGTNGGGVFKSTNGGASWTAVNTGLSSLDVRTLAISPNYLSDQTIFVGTSSGGVFKSTDGAVSWTVINTGLSYFSVSSLAIPPNYSSDQTIFAGTGGGVYKSVNGGASWPMFNAGVTGATLVISPNYAADQTIFAGTHYGGGIYKSINGRINWTTVNTGLNNILLVVNSLNMSPAYSCDRTLFAGTNSSVWKYNDDTSTEVCNGVDDNCDGLIDEGVENTYYRDADSDTYGNAFAITQACSQPSGYVSNNTDCDDSNASINPGAAEVCNGVDDNCNTQVDEGVQNTYYQDADSDTYGNASVTTQACTAPSGYVSNNADCNDSNASINPGATEVCNGVDDNCNTLIDEGGLNTYYRDADNDTYGNSAVTTQACSQPAGHVTNSADCNDSNASINSGALEVCNGVDDNCNTQVDEGYNQDGDGYTTCAGDCNDNNASIYPGVAEVCNGVDDNCNAQIDEGVQNTYYRDADNDTYGNASVSTQACTQPAGYVSNSTDCNDNNAYIKPGATEVCNGVDDNCNGQVDEGVQNTYYRDSDNDTYGNASVTTQACTQPSGYVSNSSDCNDGNASIKPNATEVCNTIDDNCNGQVDEGCPGVEVCDGIDNDGDSLIDEDFPAGNTSCGSDVQITPDGVTFTFPSVTLSGDTTVTTSGTGQPPPSGFKLGTPPTYYEIVSTATFSGTVEVCINYDETQFATERSLKLFHMEGSWKDITTSLDTTANVICGNTTSFSPFIVAESSASPTAITLQNFFAYLDGGHVVLTWSTSFERDNEGFHIQRGESAGGPFVEITPSMIPAMDGPGMKATYTFTDSGVESGKTYYYRLQDVDSRGQVTTQRVVSVNTGVADGERSSQEGTSQKTEMVSTSEQKELIAGRNSVQEQIFSAGKSTPWTSVVVESNPLTLTLSPEGRGDEDGGSVVVPPTLPHKGGGSEENGRDAKDEYSDAQPSAATTGVVALQTLHNPGPSSFSVSIEDDKGNVIVVSKGGDTGSIATRSSDLKVTEESDRVVLTWQGRGEVKGFVLHRAEKGKDNYTPLTNLIPYFGRDDKDIFIYRFTDKGVKPGVKYDYRLERVEPDHKPDLTIGKLYD